MNNRNAFFIAVSAASILLTSCNTLEQASVHGLTSGYYMWKAKDQSPRSVYLDVSNEKVDVYPVIHKEPDNIPLLSIPISRADPVTAEQFTFKKQSLDIDITSVLLKYHPTAYGSPAQLNADLNFAVYAGWRFDQYQLKTQKDPLGRQHQKISTLGYDLGFFAGPGTTAVSPFTTLNRRNDEYNGIIFQYGIAGFIESNVASFGLSIGYDQLLNPDRKIWIYRNKPWVGFVVGIALN